VIKENTRVLVVEDNRINQAIVMASLSKMQLIADIADDGVEALSMLTQSTAPFLYDLILMDCHLPKLTGYETCQAIRQGKVGANYVNIPIIAMTAGDTSTEQEKCLAAGMNDFTTKPLEHQLLRNKICQWLSFAEQCNLFTGKCISVNNTDPHSEVDFVGDNGCTSEVNTALSPKQDLLLSHTKVWQRAQFNERISGNKKVAKILIDLFICDAPNFVKTFEYAIKQRDFEALLMATHQFKGACKNIAAPRVVFVIDTIEQCIKRQKHDELPLLLNQLVMGCQQLITELQQEKLNQ
jgi:CheY-like chemotaxis protein